MFQHAFGKRHIKLENELAAQILGRQLYEVL